MSIYSYTWYIHNIYNNIYQNLWFNIYLKYYFLHIYARNVYYYKITYHVSFERNIYFIYLFQKSTYFSQSWRQHTASRASRNEEWISALPLRFFPPVHFQSETDFVRQVSSCMLRCATLRVTRRRKRELWKFRRAAPSTPLFLSFSLVFTHWNSRRQV